MTQSMTALSIEDTKADPRPRLNDYITSHNEAGESRCGVSVCDDCLTPVASQ